MFEHKDDKLISPGHFYTRMFNTLLWAGLVVAVSLAIGVAGYHVFEHLPWIDSLLNASMILGGMGPVDPMKSVAGKLFASFYALYSGLVLIGLMGLLLAPVFHRILHSFHETRH
jgi:hypothetical protein